MRIPVRRPTSLQEDILERREAGRLLEPRADLLEVEGRRHFAVQLEDVLHHALRHVHRRVSGLRRHPPGRVELSDEAEELLRLLGAEPAIDVHATAVGNQRQNHPSASAHERDETDGG